MSSDTMHPRAGALPSLEWQSELDSAMADLDSRLTHPRRRATDSPRQPVVPELGQMRVTTELLDEIAWRVADQLRKNGGGATASAKSVLEAMEAPQPAAAPPQPAPQPAPPPAALYRSAPRTSQHQSTPRPVTTDAPPRTRNLDASGLAPGKVLMLRFRLPWPFRPTRRRR